jgi:GNAT superfamily N-acetyltransferase
MTVTFPAARTMLSADATAAGAVLAAAFADDPVFGWMLPDVERRRRVLPGLFALFTEAYAPLGASHVAGPAVALWAPPGRQAVPDEAAEQFGVRLAALCGPDAERVFATVAAMESWHPHVPCHYLNLLGVDPAAQGRGLGSGLLAATLERADGRGEPAYLEATSPVNRRLYERHGFATVGEIVVPGGPTLWSMWREPRS